MIQEILKLPDFESNFEIESQKEKFRQFDKDLPDFLQDRSKLSKTGVIEIIKTKSYSRRDELLSILFWGLYFKVLARNPNSIRALMEFMSKDDFKSEMDRRVDLILESKNPSELFDSFTKNEKIPGLGYAYFTKLFFFYREALQPNGQTFPILDKWLGIAWCAISSTDNNNDSVYKNYYKPASSNVLEGALQRRKPEAYHQYVKFMNDLSQRENIQVKNLEEKLFGADLKKHPENNARQFYKNWAISKNIPLKKSEKKQKDNKPSKSVSLEITDLHNVHLIKTSTYLALKLGPNTESKIGYIDNNGNLNVSDALYIFVDKYKNDLQWNDGNTRGGSKETKYLPFDNIDEAKDFLKGLDIKLVEK